MKNNTRHIGSYSAPVLAVLISALVLFDLKFEITQKTIWYDTLLHFLGGAWTATLFLYIFSGKLKTFDGRKDFLYSIVVILGFVALIGVLWEFYEFVVDRFIRINNMLPLAQPSTADTMKDLAMDLLGGLVTAVIYFLR